MKRLVSLLVSIVLALSLSACGIMSSFTSANSVQEKNKTPTWTSTKTTTKATQAETTKTTTEATEATETIDISSGSRSNPIRVGESLGLYSDKIELAITLNSITRGKEAKRIAMDENQFNEIPDGKELIIANITLMLGKYVTDDDSSFAVSSWDFTFFDLTYSEIDQTSVVIPDEFGGEMYPGASKTGNIYIVVDDGTSNYARIYDKFWFDLSGN